MFDKLIEFLTQFLDAFRVCCIVHDYERAVVLRYGRYHRSLEPGLHGLIPLYLETAFVTNVVPSTTNLASQSLTTSDQVSVVLSAVVTWQVTDPKVFLLGVEDARTVLADSVYGIIARETAKLPWEKLASEDFTSLLTRRVRAKTKHFGIDVQQVNLSDLTRCRSIRLITGNGDHSGKSHVE